eukprot:4044206-Pleurochrysis_carterae.AAC.1
MPPTAFGTSAAVAARAVSANDAQKGRLSSGTPAADMRARSSSSGWRMSAIVREGKSTLSCCRTPSSRPPLGASAACSAVEGMMARPSCSRRSRASRSSTSSLGALPPDGHEQ